MLRTRSVRNGMGKAHVLVPRGTKVGNWTVVRKAPSTFDGRGDEQHRYILKCQCGAKVSHILSNARHSQSCGCKQVELMLATSRERGVTTRTHGLSRNILYYRYNNMKDRCYRPSNSDFPNYGGRGIIVCDRWLQSFQAFVDDMGHPPPRTSLDRIDVNGNYTPENCRWVDDKTQATNKRTTIMVTLHGEIMSVSEACRRLGREVSVPNSLRVSRGFTHQQAIDFLATPWAMERRGRSCFGRLVAKRVKS
jgi:hypothetical protein